MPLAKLAARVMAGRSLDDLGFTEEIVPTHVSVKESVFPFVKFPGVDTILGPEMKSTGEVMGIDATFGAAVRQGPDRRRDGPADERARCSSACATRTRRPCCRRRAAGAMGFALVATQGTARHLRRHGLQVETINKVSRAVRTVSMR